MHVKGEEPARLTENETINNVTLEKSETQCGINNFYPINFTLWPLLYCQKFQCVQYQIVLHACIFTLILFLKPIGVGSSRS